MADASSGFLSSIFPHKRVRTVIGVLMALLLLTFLLRLFSPLYIDYRWETLSSELVKERTRALQSSFTTYQEKTLEAVKSLSTDAHLRVQIRRNDSSSNIVLFEIATGHATDSRDLGITFQIMDAQGEIVAWTGNRQPGLTKKLLLSRPNFHIIQGPIYSYFFVSIPITDGSSNFGHVVGKRLFEVNYPINNRLISNAAFSSAFTAGLQDRPKFFFGEDPELSHAKGENFFIPLHGLNGQVLAYAVEPIPSQGTELSNIISLLDLISSVVLLLIFAVVITSFIFQPVAHLKTGVGLLSISVGIWAFRALLLLLEVPSGVNENSIFSPHYFASPFGFGLAKSLGDVFISSLFLLTNVILIAWWLLKRIGHHNKDYPRWNAFIVPILAFGFFLLMRAFCATIHSAVFDSSLGYNDPTMVLPSMTFSVMLLSLFLLAFALVIVGVGLVVLSQRFLFGRMIHGKNSTLSWIATGAIFAAVGLAYGGLFSSTLMSQSERLVAVALLIPIAWACHWMYTRTFEAVRFRIPAVLFLASIILVVPLLDRKVHELDRVHVELLAAEMIRPTDSWLSFMLDKSLNEISNSEAAEILETGTAAQVDKLAFTQWAQSILSREGKSCAVTFVDNEGSVISDFHIGTAGHWSRRHHMDEMPRSTRITTIEERANGGDKTIKWYRGYTPVRNQSGDFLGGVWVEVSGDVAELPEIGRGEELLRNTTRENRIPNARTIIRSEYVQGRLSTSTSELFPTERHIPDALKSLSQDQSSMWLEENVDGQMYESYYVRESSTPERDSWLSLSMTALGLQWHIYSFLRYGLFYVLVSGIILILLLIIALLRRRRMIDFRMKLLTAFVIVSFIPVVILAYFNRQYAVRRAEERTVRQLNEQTTLILGELQRRFGMTVPAVLDQLTDEDCDAVAQDFNLDFNIFFGSALRASSRPEIFTAELLNPGITSSAYLNIVLKRKPFFVEREAIGQFPYLVGYRSLVAGNGSIVGTVSVPTLFRQSEVDEELARRTIFLYGAYIFALAISIVIGSVFANQIAAPIRRLRKAIEQIARGDMNVELRQTGSDELSRLEGAFRQMTHELRITQDQMKRAERELAWREMAKQVAHEIKNPLTPMKLSMQHLLQAHRDKAKNFSEILERVGATLLEQIDTLSRIASEFSNFARLPDRLVEPVHVHEVIQESVNLFTGEQTKFSSEFLATNDRVLADREEMRRAFINILRNSVQAMNGQEGHIRICTETTDHGLSIAFHDTGSGIAPEIRDRLFEPDFSTKKEGMGLGLSIVKSIVEKAGGKIDIKSQPGNGATVTISLPTYTEKTE